ncbi:MULTISPECIES: Cthe_2314 family HEPN domain-containing protein [Paenibacillus]|uniref:Uncharacterized protein n=1 Tax=Paenibacillus naphthalenovorans TaxID=162209 RepID=A0A0U2VAS5_9BACL|nr:MULTISPECIES: Cthe_2314 family HEPN domain-containing protein [Paenibacillus]ALS20691.1 hypothetical protein IJ22_03020 [Paenibacillus naphthalenovorans]GCL70722.1 hypothetical protein PN4B1_06240 [Paenibacillus naphthalenovorans]
MLRAMFGEPPRKDAGLLLEAIQAIRKYMYTLTSASRQSSQERRYIIWCQSFLRTLDDLEQSQFAAVRFGRKVSKKYTDQMSAEELDDYHRHLYYYNNALIRVFAVLDKLGHFMNERFSLHTERVKSRFSYFTVLRHMHKDKRFSDLEQQLYELKIKYNEPLNRLRNQRNMEIHTINADLLDDLMKAAEAKYGEQIRIGTEDIQQNLQDLEQGCQMTFRAAAEVFRYLHRRS